MWQIQNPEEPGQLLAWQRYQLDFATSPGFATLASGGWGSGKTAAGLGFIAFNLWRSPPRSTGIAVLPSYPMMKEWLEETFLPAFERVVVGINKDRRVVYLPGGRKMLYRSAHVPKTIQMSNASWCYVDEPHLMKREAWRHIVGRVRKAKSDIRIGLASLPKMGWLSEEFNERSDLQRRCLYFETEQNRHVHQDYVRNLRRVCPASMQDCYLRGRFVPAGGSVYPMFGDGSVIPWRYGPVTMKDGSRTEPVVNLAVDWSPRRPHVLWIQRVPPGARMPGGWATTREVSIVVDEMFPDGRYQPITVKRLCAMAYQRRPYTGLASVDHQPYPLECFVCDPAGKAVQATSGESEIIQAQRYLDGLPSAYLTGQRVMVGVQHVQLALEPMDSHPFLFFAESLRDNPDPCGGYGDPDENRERSVLRAMAGYSFPEEVDGRLPDEPFHDDVFSHACDCVRYHVRYFYPADRLTAEAWTIA